MSHSEQITGRAFEGTCAMEGEPCENCGGKGTMRRFAQDTFYWYLKCQNKACQKERLELRTTVNGQVNAVNSVNQG